MGAPVVEAPKVFIDKTEPSANPAQSKLYKVSTTETEGFSMAEPFLTQAHFESLCPGTERSSDQDVIKARREVVDRYRWLHGEIGHQMARWQLHPHPNFANWTNTFYPKWEANGEYVDYLRFSYGKERSLVRQMAERSGTQTEIAWWGSIDKFPFHYVAQVQIGMTCDYWFFNFYVDDKGWLEVKNLLAKIRKPAEEQRFLALLIDLHGAGYNLALWSSEYYRQVDRTPLQPEVFIEALRTYDAKKYTFNVDIHLPLRPTHPQNRMDRITQLAFSNFEQLLPLYRFWAWEPRLNNHLGL